MKEVKNLKINYDLVKKKERKYKLYNLLNCYSKVGYPASVALLAANNINKIIGEEFSNLIGITGLVILTTTLMLKNNIEDVTLNAKYDFESCKEILNNNEKVKTLEM